MRGVRGVQAAALVREAGPAGSYRVSLRAADPAVDVARSPARRAGAATARRPASAPGAPPDDLLAWLEAASRPGSTATAAMAETALVDPAAWLVNKPAGPTSHDIVARSAAGWAAASRWGTAARSTRSRPACWW